MWRSTKLRLQRLEHFIRAPTPLLYTVKYQDEKIEEVIARYVEETAQYPRITINYYRKKPETSYPCSERAAKDFNNGELNKD